MSFFLVKQCETFRLLFSRAYAPSKSRIGFFIKQLSIRGRILYVIKLVS